MQTTHSINPLKAAAQGFRVLELKPFKRNTLRAFVVLELPSGLILNDLTLHQKGDSRWVSMPGRQFEKNGEKNWAPLIEFSSKESRDKFQIEAIKAIDTHLGEEGKL